jgi:hypothetical protein
MQSTRYSCQISMNLEFSRQIFEKYLNFRKTRPVGAELFHANAQTDGRTGRHTGRNESNSHFHKFAKAPTNALCGQNIEFFNVTTDGS